jgi:cytochrome c-type biogenesis protein CcmE
MKKNAKFAVLIAIILGTLVWVGTSAVKENKSFYKTVSEIQKSPDEARAEKVRVAGDVAQGSIHRKAGEVDFVLIQDKQTLRVAYTGEDPLPDTFRDGAQALAEGKLGADGVFQAKQIQAKCASKYESKPGQAPAGLKAPSRVSKASL